MQNRGQPSLFASKIWTYCTCLKSRPLVFAELPESSWYCRSLDKKFLAFDTKSRVKATAALTSALRGSCCACSGPDIRWVVSKKFNGNMRDPHIEDICKHLSPNSLQLRRLCRSCAQHKLPAKKHVPFESISSTLCVTDDRICFWSSSGKYRGNNAGQLAFHLEGCCNNAESGSFD